VGKSFAKRGIEILTGVSVAGLEKKGGGVEAVLSDGTSRMAEKVLVSVGRRPNTAGIGIDELLDGKGFVTVDSSMKTVREGVWAAGDCIGGMMLAHVAAAEAETAIKNILGGGGHEMDYDAVPACVFTSPEVAGVGISEDEAKRRGIHVSTGRFFYQANGQALALGDDEGQIKIVAEKGGRLLGATIIGKGASSMISEIALAVAHKMKPSELYDVIHAHPTLGEATMEAAADIDGMAIHRAAQKRR
jgi:dihydrolipoamide dehydrogenase